MLSQSLRIRSIAWAASAVISMAPFAAAAPMVTSTTTLNIAGSGYDAIDFYYESTADAEFTNYRLNFETTNGASIYDPLPQQRENAGSGAIDTFMNTVGSYLGLGPAAQIHNTYKPSFSATEASSLAQIDWSVFDTLSGDTNHIPGYDAAPYHLARVLVTPDAVWKASFMAFDTFTAGIPTTVRFAKDSPPEIELYIPPPPPPAPPEPQPPAPPPALPDPPIDVPAPPFEPQSPPATDDPPWTDPDTSHDPVAPDITLYPPDTLFLRPEWARFFPIDDRAGIDWGEHHFGEIVLIDWTPNVGTIDGDFGVTPDDGFHSKYVRTFSDSGAQLLLLAAAAVPGDVQALDHVAAVPEPATAALTALALTGVVGCYRRQKP